MPILAELEASLTGESGDRSPIKLDLNCDLKPVLLFRVLIELVSKMQEMTMDKTELGCLRAIVLFNPDVKGLQDINRVEQLRERVYATLEEYTR